MVYWGASVLLMPASHSKGGYAPKSLSGLLGHLHVAVTLAFLALVTNGCYRPYYPDSFQVTSTQMIDIFATIARWLLTITSAAILTTPIVEAAAPNIGGDVDIDVELASVTNVAIADDAIAMVIIGSFLEGDTEGDFKTSVKASHVTNAAIGSRACSLLIIGSVAGNLPCFSADSR